jgi:hypothetical protein
MGEGEMDATKACDYIRYAFGTILTAISTVIIVYSIAAGHAALPGHPGIQYPLLVFDLTLLAYLEGLQVAILALEKVRTSTMVDLKRAAASHKLALARRGLNVQRFLVGRQFFVVFVVFLCAQLTTYRTLNQDMTFLPPVLYTILIETGLPGALIVLAFGQLMPQLVAATHPITFMNLPGTWSVIQLCLCFETVGVTHFSWVLSFTVKFIFSMGPKETCKRRIPRATEMTNKKIKKDNEGTVADTIDMDVVVGDADALYAGAEDGLALASNKAIHSQDVTRWLQNDSIRALAGQYGDDDDGGNTLPDAATIVRQLVANDMPVPRYLLPAYHPEYIPPYIVAYELLRRENLRKQHNPTGNQITA